MEVIERNNRNMGGAGGGQNGSSGGNTITTEVLIPGNKCGLVIGKGGETIKSLQVVPSTDAYNHVDLIPRFFSGEPRSENASGAGVPGRLLVR